MKEKNIERCLYAYTNKAWFQLVVVDGDEPIIWKAESGEDSSVDLVVVFMFIKSFCQQPP